MGVFNLVQKLRSILKLKLWNGRVWRYQPYFPETLSYSNMLILDFYFTTSLKNTHFRTFKLVKAAFTYINASPSLIITSKCYVAGLSNLKPFALQRLMTSLLPRHSYPLTIIFINHILFHPAKNQYLNHGPKRLWTVEHESKSSKSERPYPFYDFTVEGLQSPNLIV